MFGISLMDQWIIHNRKKLKTCLFLFFFTLLRSLVCVYCCVIKSERWCCWMFVSRPCLLKVAVIFLLLCVGLTPSSQGGMSYSGVISSSQQNRLNSSLHPPLSEEQTGWIIFPLLFIPEQSIIYTVTLSFYVIFLIIKAENKNMYTTTSKILTAM